MTGAAGRPSPATACWNPLLTGTTVCSRRLLARPRAHLQLTPERRSARRATRCERISRTWACLSSAIHSMEAERSPLPSRRRGAGPPSSRPGRRVPARGHPSGAVAGRGQAAAGGWKGRGRQGAKAGGRRRAAGPRRSTRGAPRTIRASPGPAPASPHPATPRHRPTGDLRPRRHRRFSRSWRAACPS